MKITVSPYQFDKMKRVIMTMEAKGYGPPECAVAALAWGGIRLEPNHPLPSEVVVVVDWSSQER